MKNDLPPELTAQLNRMVRRVKVILLVRGLLAVVSVLVGMVLTIMAIDAAVVLVHPVARWVFSLSGLVLVLATAWSLLLLPLARPLTLTRMARILETRHPDMQERISSSIELACHGGTDAEQASAELVKLLTLDAKSDLAGVHPRQEFTARTVKPFLLGTACVLALLGTLFAVWPKQSWLLFLRALAPHREFDTLQASVLDVKPGDVMRLAKTPLRFEVIAPERHGLRAEIQFLRPGSRPVVERMKRLSAQGIDPVVFELEIPSVEASFEYRVRYGNGYTRPYSVLVVNEPSIQETRVSYAYPAYTGLLPTQQVGEAQAIMAVAGTRIRIEGTFDRACTAALQINALTLMNPAGIATNGVWLQTMSTNRNGRWTLALRDAYGFTNRPGWAAYSALPDRPPEVTLSTPEASRLNLPPYDKLICEGSASDDFGLGALELVIQSEKRSEQREALKATRRGGTRVDLEGAPDLQALYDRGIRSFNVFLRVADNLPPELGGPQIRESRILSVNLDMGARTLREQVREALRKELEKDLQKAAKELHEAANRVAQEKWSFDRPELSAKAAEKLEEARAAAVKAEELLEKAARATAKTPFAAFAKDILDVRDEKVEPAFLKLEKIPLTETEKRKPLGEETERAFREAAEKVNELTWRALQEESRKQEEQGRLAELAQREAALAEKAESAKMDRQAMQEWTSRQNEAEQKLWQSKPQLEDAAFNKVLENLRLARETMQQQERAMTPEEDQAVKRETYAAREAEKASSLAEKAAEQAVTAAEKAAEVAATRAASDAVRKAAEKTAAAAKKAEKAAQEAQAAAEKRLANEAVADAAGRKAVAEQAAQAAQQSAEAAKEASQSAEQAEQAVAARPQAGQEEQARKAETCAKAQAAAAKKAAQEANAKAVESARLADEKGLEKAAEAGQLASESASFTQRAGELAKAAAEKSEMAAALPEEKRGEALKEARGLSEQARQVAAEAQEKSAAAVQRAKEQLEQLAQAEQAAAARQASPDAIKAQAQEAVKNAHAAVAQAQQAVDAAKDAVAEAQEAAPQDQALAAQMTEASALAQQAGELARQSGERTQQAETADLGDARERAETRQAMAEAQAAAQLAKESAALARQAAQQTVAEMADLKQATAAAAQVASRQANEAAQAAQQAGKIAQSMKHQKLQQAAEQSGQSAKLTGEASALAQQAVQTSALASGPTDAQAASEAKTAQEKAEQALALARQSRKQTEERMAAEARQLAAAEKARQLADTFANVVEAQTMREADAWAKTQVRLGGKTRHAAADGEGGGADYSRRVPVNQDWIRFRGEAGSESYEEMLKKTPAEYRGLVKQYFEELSREGQDAQK